MGDSWMLSQANADRDTRTRLGEAKSPTVADVATAKQRAVNVVLGGENTVLTIRRQRSGRRYCVLPGGGIEYGETPEHAAIRELLEETGLSGEIVRHLGNYEHSDRFAHYFLVSVTPGTLRLGRPERDAHSNTNSYNPEWISLSDLDANNLQPEQIRPMVRSFSRNGPVVT